MIDNFLYILNQTIQLLFLFIQNIFHICRSLPPKTGRLKTGFRPVGTCEYFNIQILKNIGSYILEMRHYCNSGFYFFTFLLILSSLVIIFIGTHYNNINRNEVFLSQEKYCFFFPFHLKLQSYLISTEVNFYSILKKSKDKKFSLKHSVNYKFCCLHVFD